MRHHTFASGPPLVTTLCVAPVMGDATPHGESHGGLSRPRTPEANVYQKVWYWCDIRESEKPAPDFERVPAEKREQVRQRWLAGLPEKRWKLWGPQIPFYQRCASMAVTVVGPVEETC